MSEVMDASALVNVRRARSTVREARGDYHEAVAAAARRGFTAEEIADALDTNPLYISSLLRRHADGSCGCGRG